MTDLDPDIPRRDLPNRTLAFAQAVVTLCLAIEPSRASVERCAASCFAAQPRSGRMLRRARAVIAERTLPRSTASPVRRREARYWLRLLRGADIVAPDRIAPLIDEAGQLVAILTTIVRKVKNDP